MGSTGPGADLWVLGTPPPFPALCNSVTTLQSCSSPLFLFVLTAFGSSGAPLSHLSPVSLHIVF